MKVFKFLILFIPFGNLYSAEKYYLLCAEEFIQVNVKALEWSKFSAVNWTQMEKFRVQSGKLRIEEDKYRFMVQVKESSIKYSTNAWYPGYSLDRTTLELHRSVLGLVEPPLLSDPSKVLCDFIEESLYNSMKNSYLNMKKDNRKSRLENRKM